MCSFPESGSGKTISGPWNHASLLETLDFVFISFCYTITITMFPGRSLLRRDGGPVFAELGDS